MIPKVIHYCWFGGNEKSEIIKQCIASWKKYCPDYEIIEWNESNFDINCCQYVKEAYEAKKWAFVSDYARYKIIYEHGGIYLDTDVELLDNLDKYLIYDTWFPRETQRTFNTGVGFAAIKNNKLIKKLYLARNNIKFDGTICTFIDTPIIFEHLNLDYSNDSIKSGSNYIFGQNEYSKIAFHHETRTWMTENDRVFLKKRAKKHKLLKSILRNDKIINFIYKHNDCKILKLYIFVAYDLIDNGLSHYFKLIYKKIFK